MLQSLLYNTADCSADSSNRSHKNFNVLLQTEILTTKFSLERFALLAMGLSCFLLSFVMGIVKLLSSIATLNIILKYGSCL